MFFSQAYRAVSMPGAASVNTHVLIGEEDQGQQIWIELLK